MAVKDLAALQALMGAKTPDEVRKALTTASGFIGYNLEPTAKLMLPLFAGLRNRIAVDKPAQGAADATWRMQLGYGSFDFGANANFGTAFGGVGGATTPSAVTVSASYKTQAIKGEVQFEAIPQARGFDDPLAIETSMALSSLIRLEELLVLGGNQVSLGAPVPVGNPSTATAVNTFATGNWTVTVTALTLQGTIANASADSKVGESLAGTVVVAVPGGDCDFLDVSWPAVAGAVGYKVYCESAEGAGNALLVPPVTGLKYRKITAGATDLANFGDAFDLPTGQTFVTVNHVQIVAVGSGAAYVAADDTDNANVFEGLIAWCQKTTMYGQALGGSHFTKDCNGAPLTTAGSGVSEFDYILQNLWKTWQINPTLIVTSPQGASNLTDKLVAANNAAMYRIELNQERGGMTGGLFVGGYLNKFAASLMGYSPATIPVWAHPYMPDGTFLFLTERVPYQYSREARGFALDVITPYTYFELARSTRTFPFSTFFTETMKCYHPLAQASIVGARVV
jgi:hypothetical protein